MIVSVSVCVCPSAIISSEKQVRFSPNFFCAWRIYSAFVALANLRYINALNNNNNNNGRGSVLLWQRCDILYISGFVDDVMSQGCSTSPPGRSAVHTQPWAWL